MKLHRIFYTQDVVRYLKHLSPQVKPLLKSIIEELGEDPSLGKPLQREMTGYRVLRYKKYRVIYEHNEAMQRIEIIFAGLRKDVYQLFAELLRRKTKS